MNDTVRLWVEKAEGDFRTAEREVVVEVQPTYDAVYFHAQQCVEKLLKAVLIANQTLAPKTHELVTLSQLVKAIIPTLYFNEFELNRLSEGAVDVRYPNDLSDREDAEEAMAICRKIRAMLLPILMK